MKKRLAAVVVAGVIGGGFGFAPAAFAWVNPSTHWVEASCWRWIGTDNGRFGVDAEHQWTPGGGIQNKYWHQVDAWLKYNGRDKAYVGRRVKGYVSLRDTYDGVDGGGGWTVYARHTADDGTRESDSCTIT